MALVAAKCTQCGAAIEVEDTKDAGICNFCGTAFITQKVINEYHTHVTKHITKNVFGIEGKSADDFCDKGDTFVKLEDWKNGEDAYEQATKLQPSNYRGWFGLVKVCTKGFTNYFDYEHIKYLKKASAVAGDDEKKIIDTTYVKYQQVQSKHMSELLAQYLSKVEYANQKFDSAVKIEKNIRLMYLLGYTIILMPISLPLYNKYNKQFPIAQKLFFEAGEEVKKAESLFTAAGLEFPKAQKKWEINNMDVKHPWLDDSDSMFEIIIQ